jgi:hypothetical protein
VADRDSDSAEKAAREAARQIAREHGLSSRETKWYEDREAERFARRAKERPYPEVTVVPVDKLPVVARFGAVDEIDGRFVGISGELVVTPGGTAVIRSLAVKPHNARERDFEITATLLRQIHIAEIRRRAVRAIFERRDDFEAAKGFGWPMPDEFETAALELAVEAAELPAKRPGRTGYPDDHYRRIALAYLSLLEQGEGRGVLKALAAAEGKPRETVRDWVRIARKRGFLTEGRQGRAGAQAGPNLYERREDQ